jgi:hypothetical protein
VTLPILSFCMGYPEEICWALFDMLTYASTTQKIMCFFELSLFSCIPTIVYKLIVKSMCACSSVPIYSYGPSSHSISEWLGEANTSTSSTSWIGSKQLYSAYQEANPASSLFYLGVLSSLCQECHGNCTSSYGFLIQWYFSPPSFISRSPCCCNRNTNKWIMMCEINTPSNSVAR